MWSFDPKRWSHWLLLVFIAGFLVSYFGFVSWGRLGDALEALAERPAGAQIFHEKIDRADAIFMIFVFLFLTPLALVAGFSIVTFVGSVLTGMLEAIYRRPGKCRSCGSVMSPSGIRLRSAKLSPNCLRRNYCGHPTPARGAWPRRRP